MAMFSCPRQVAGMSQSKGAVVVKRISFEYSNLMFQTPSRPRQRLLKQKQHQTMLFSSASSPTDRGGKIPAHVAFFGLLFMPSVVYWAYYQGAGPTDRDMAQKLREHGYGPDINQSAGKSQQISKLLSQVIDGESGRKEEKQIQQILFAGKGEKKRPNNANNVGEKELYETSIGAEAGKHMKASKLNEAATSGDVVTRQQAVLDRSIAAFTRPRKKEDALIGKKYKISLVEEGGNDESTADNSPSVSDPAQEAVANRRQVVVERSIAAFTKPKKKEPEFAHKNKVDSLEKAGNNESAASSTIFLKAPGPTQQAVTLAMVATLAAAVGYLVGGSGRPSRGS